MTDFLAQLRENRSRRDAALKERDRLIREAAAARVPKTRIAEAVGLSAMEVHRILREPDEPAEIADR